MFDRRHVQYFDWGLLGLTVLLGSLGLLTLYSAVMSASPSPHKLLHVRQLIWFGIGFVIMIVSFSVNYKLLDRWAHAIYIIGIILLVCVLLFGKYVGGAKRWLMVGPVSSQPME